MARLDSLDPANGEVVGSVEVASRAAVEQAVGDARGAQEDWARHPPDERAAVILRFRDLLLERREEAARLVVRESGKPYAEALMADVLTALETAKHLVRAGPGVLADEKVRLHNPLLYDRRSMVTREPLGVVGVIAPWNYPLSIPATGVLTALMAGNGVVVKPSEHTPLIGQWLVDRLHDAGVPDALVAVVHGAGPVGAALVEAPIDGVLFTGSVETGQKVAAGCAPRMAPAILELGGKDPMVVLDGAKQDLTVAGASWGAFTNAGQTCAAVERLYVPEAVAAGYVADLQRAASGLHLGHGLEKGTQMGPVIEDAAVKRILDQLKDAEKKGATVVCGGAVRDDLGPRFIEPTVLSGVDHEMDIMRDETFGPVLPVQTYGHVDEAVHLANDSRYGLSASVWGPRSIAEAVARRIEAGTIAVNDCLYTYAAPETPWGGWKESGVGASHGPWGLEAVTRWRHIHTAPDGRRRSPWYYPYDDGLVAFLDDGMRFLHGGARGKAKAPSVLKAWSRRRKRHTD